MVVRIRAAQNARYVCRDNRVYVQVIVDAERFELLCIYLPLNGWHVFIKQPVRMDAAARVY